MTKSNHVTPFWRWFFGSIFSLIGKLGRISIITAGACYCTFLLARAIESFAGRQSFANLRFGVALFADIKVVYTIGVAIGVTGVTLYLRERNQHRNTRERLTQRTIELESKVDRGRSSSKLTKRGTTRREDE
jgi:hypothetical protein